MRKQYRINEDRLPQKLMAITYKLTQIPKK